MWDSTGQSRGFCMFVLLMHLLSHLRLHSEEMGDNLKWKVLHPSCFFCVIFFFSIWLNCIQSSHWVQVVAPSLKSVIKTFDGGIFIVAPFYFSCCCLCICVCLFKVSESTLDGFCEGWEKAYSPQRMAHISSFFVAHKNNENFLCAVVFFTLSSCITSASHLPEIWIFYHLLQSWVYR